VKTPGERLRPGRIRHGGDARSPVKVKAKARSRKQASQRTIDQKKKTKRKERKNGKECEAVKKHRA